MNLLSLFAASAFVALPAGEVDVKEASKEIVGVWKLDLTTPDQERRTPLVVVGRQHNELVAWYLADGGPEPCADVRLDGDSLHLTVRPKEFYGEVTAKLQAQLEHKGACVGTIKYADLGGETGAIGFTGKQLDVRSFDEASEWDLDFTTPDGLRRRAHITAVQHQQKLYGWYSSKDFELPATKLTKDGEQVVMEISAKTREGEKVDVTFRGVIDGNRVAGDADFALEYDSGSFRFEGRREQ